MEKNVKKAPPKKEETKKTPMVTDKKKEISEKELDKASGGRRFFGNG